MNSTATGLYRAGLYGKVPAHGDFIDRGLPGSFINVWDDWLQRSVASSREVLGESWLDYYLTSPIWRFVLAPGAVDNGTRAGVLLPSVDSVGRYFPLTIAAAVDNKVNTFSFLAEQEDWFSQLENAALAALQESLPVDELMQRLAGLPMPAHSASQTLHKSDSLVTGTAVVATGEPALPAGCYNQLLQQFTQARLSSYSLWWCNGSDHMQPTLLLAPGLPNAQGYTALLDGQWQQWGWML
ncbi:type VI secretion system-associated protein TagF [Exilibacterium tricleocarpae]|uniref:Type VI secretion system-associated protein TagF n=1 Tax=Exilibacterium tricleocarpae TaxID=2591008 RepID=A0A545SPJ6_9GAMM|nr:type VI secretion system-associated protein TagF [Exilibacterium tricleocarpae]TQV66910.1 type VI secretion system-associated protein TagF [Exilibacterium tricleocarpae]